MRYTISNRVKEEDHTWRVLQGRAESLIIMAGPPNKNFQQSPLLLIAKALI